MSGVNANINVLNAMTKTIAEGDAVTSGRMTESTKDKSKNKEDLNETDMTILPQQAGYQMSNTSSPIATESATKNWLIQKLKDKKAQEEADKK